MQAGEPQKIDFKTVHGELQTRDFHVRTDFFRRLDQDEITDGDVDVHVSLRESTEGVFVVGIKVQGQVTVSCDRCLSDLILPVENAETIKFAYAGLMDADEVETISDKSGEYDLSWLIYEIIEVSLPLHRVHSEGACDAEMEKRLKLYRPNNGE